MCDRSCVIAVLWMMAITVSACGGEGSGTADVATDTIDDTAANDSLWQQVTECGLEGTYVVTGVSPDPDDCASLLPETGTDLVLDRDEGGAPRLRLGGVTLSALAIGADCAMSAVGCDSDEASMTSVAVAMTRTGSGLALEIEPAVVVEHRLRECPVQLTVSAERPDACRFAGRFEVLEDAALTAGSCDLEWGADTVTVAPDTYELTWGTDSPYEALSVDEERCEIVYDGGLIFYNGVTRTVVITMGASEEGATFRIEDALEGRDDVGNTCTEAVFEATGERRTSGGPAPLPNACESEPYVCGNASCDVDNGEGCDVCREDCGCQDDEVCLGTPGVCRIQCSVWDDQCPSGMRCTFVRGDSAWSENPSRNLCEQFLDERTAGQPCESSRECAAGLVCVDDLHTCWPLCRTNASEGCDGSCRHAASLNTDPVGGCAPFCTGSGAVACGADTYCATFELSPNPGSVSCGLRGDIDASYCTRNFDSPGDLCYAAREGDAPVLGGSCSEELPCPVGLRCVGVDCRSLLSGNLDCDRFVCTHECVIDQECPAELATCFGYCLDF